MPGWFVELNPVVQALLATLFTWCLTALGAAVVFAVKELSRKVMDGMLGFAAGVMIAASYWSLLAPAIEMSEEGPVAGLGACDSRLPIGSRVPATGGLLSAASAPGHAD